MVSYFNNGVNKLFAFDLISGLKDSFLEILERAIIKSGYITSFSIP